MWIYKITNNINGKVYIGQTIKPIKERFHRHITDAMTNKLDTHFARAIRKYGPDNFIIETIDTASNQKELTEKEYYWIKYYNAVKEGYNETEAEYKCGGNTYKSKTPEEMEIIKEKIRQTKLGDKNPRHRRVKAINYEDGTETIYGSMCEAARELGFSSHVAISRRCLGRIKSLYKGKWFFEYFDE